MVLKECSIGCFKGCPSSDKELSCGLAGIMPRGQMYGCTREWTRGIKPPHYQYCPSNNDQILGIEM